MVVKKIFKLEYTIPGIVVHIIPYENYEFDLFIQERSSIECNQLWVQFNNYKCMLIRKEL